MGSLIELEAIAFPAVGEEGRIRFNDTAGSMTKDSVANAAAVFRKENGHSLGEYDVHINIIGGGKVDGPSAGAAIFLAITSAVFNRPVLQDVAISGELSIQGRIKPVGGIYQKIIGAQKAGIRTVLIPYANQPDIPVVRTDIIPIKHIQEAIHCICRRKLARRLSACVDTMFAHLLLLWLGIRSTFRNEITVD